MQMMIPLVAHPLSRKAFLVSTVLATTTLALSACGAHKEPVLLANAPAVHLSAEQIAAIAPAAGPNSSQLPSVTPYSQQTSTPPLFGHVQRGRIFMQRLRDDGGRAKGTLADRIEEVAQRLVRDKFQDQALQRDEAFAAQQQLMAEMVKAASADLENTLLQNMDSQLRDALEQVQVFAKEQRMVQTMAEDAVNQLAAQNKTLRAEMLAQNETMEATMKHALAMQHQTPHMQGASNEHSAIAFATETGATTNATLHADAIAASEQVLADVKAAVRESMVASVGDTATDAPSAEAITNRILASLDARTQAATLAALSAPSFQEKIDAHVQAAVAESKPMIASIAQETIANSESTISAIARSAMTKNDPMLEQRLADTARRVILAETDGVATTVRRMVAEEVAEQVGPVQQIAQRKDYVQRLTQTLAAAPTESQAHVPNQATLPANTAFAQINPTLQQNEIAAYAPQGGASVASFEAPQAVASYSNAQEIASSFETIQPTIVATELAETTNVVNAYDADTLHNGFVTHVQPESVIKLGNAQRDEWLRPEPLNSYSNVGATSFASANEYTAEAQNYLVDVPVPTVYEDTLAAHATTTFTDGTAPTFASIDLDAPAIMLGNGPRAEAFGDAAEGWTQTHVGHTVTNDASLGNLSGMDTYNTTLQDLPAHTATEAHNALAHGTTVAGSAGSVETFSPEAKKAAFNPLLAPLAVGAPFLQVFAQSSAKQAVHPEDFPVVIHAENIKLRDIFDHALRQAQPFIGNWNTEWKLRDENADLPNETFSLNAELTLGQLCTMVKDHFMNGTNASVNLMCTFAPEHNELRMSDHGY